MSHKIINDIYTTFGALFIFLFKVLRLHILNQFSNVKPKKNYVGVEQKPRISCKSQFPDSDLLIKQKSEILILVKSRRILTLMCH